MRLIRMLVPDSLSRYIAPAQVPHSHSEQVIESMNRVVNSMHVVFRTMPASNRTILKAMAGRIAFVQDKLIATIKRK